MIAAAPESGCIVPILYGLAAAKAARHGAGNIVAPNRTAPVAAADRSMRRRVILPWLRGIAHSLPVPQRDRQRSGPRPSPADTYSQLRRTCNNRAVDWARGGGRRTAARASRRAAA